jgi:hypothetical protein
VEQASEPITAILPATTAKELSGFAANPKNGSFAAACSSARTPAIGSRESIRENGWLSRGGLASWNREEDYLIWRDGLLIVNREYLGRMSTSQLIRLGGLAAIVAGLLRGGSSFLPNGEPTDSQELLYLVIDLSILFGLLGIYAYQNEVAGRSGFGGFVLAMVGTAMITGPDGIIGGVKEYVAGALLISIGLVFLAIGAWRAAKLPRYVPLLWVTSTVIGVGGFALSGPPVLLTIAGLAFGAGFIGAGVTIWFDPALRAR